MHLLKNSFFLAFWYIADNTGIVSGLRVVASASFIEIKFTYSAGLVGICILLIGVRKELLFRVVLVILAHGVGFEGIGFIYGAGLVELYTLPIEMFLSLFSFSNDE